MVSLYHLNALNLRDVYDKNILKSHCQIMRDEIHTQYMRHLTEGGFFVHYSNEVFSFYPFTFQ